MRLVGNFDNGSGHSIQHDSARAEQLLDEAIESNPNNGMQALLTERLPESRPSFASNPAR